MTFAYSVSAADDEARRLSMLVLIENELVRYGIASMLDNLAGVGEVWTCGTGDEAQTMMARHRPDIILCHGTGAAAASVGQAAKMRQVRVLLLLEDLELALVEETVLLAADGFLMQQEATVEALQAAIDRLALDELLLPSELARALMRRVRGAATSRREPPICLTPREREVLNLLAQGCSNKQIARRLALSEHGVKRHVTNLLAKLNAPNRTLAVAVALRKGLILSSV
jgi:two-component system nitrate/nitrite response regulator NarL